MLFNVPQYIDVEDKIVGPLTGKQLGWMAAMGVILLVLWNVLPKILFFILAIPIVLVFVALAFYKPYGQPLGSFVIFGIMYFFRPKVYFWKRPQKMAVKQNQQKEVNVMDLPQKQVSEDTLKSLAQLVDSGGTAYNKNLDELIKKAQIKK